MNQGCFNKVSRIFHINFKGVSRKILGSFKEVSMVFRGNFKSVSGKLYGCFMNILMKRVLREFKGVS